MSNVLCGFVDVIETYIDDLQKIRDDCGHDHSMPPDVNSLYGGLTLDEEIGFARSRLELVKAMIAQKSQS